MPADLLLQAERDREIEALLDDLRVVARVAYVAPGRILFAVKQLGLFGDRTLPPELEVMRLVRQLAEKGRLMLVRDEQDGRRITVSLRSGQQLVLVSTARPPAGRRRT